MIFQLDVVKRFFFFSSINFYRIKTYVHNSIVPSFSDVHVLVLENTSLEKMFICIYTSILYHEGYCNSIKVCTLLSYNIMKVTVIVLKYVHFYPIS